MDQLPGIVTFTFNMVSTFFTWVMSSWVTASFVIAYIMVFIANLVISSGSGSDDNK